MFKNILAINWWGGGRDGGFEDMKFEEMKEHDVEIPGVGNVHACLDSIHLLLHKNK